jgi:DNA-binding GntR family transcriptional regulator
MVRAGVTKQRQEASRATVGAPDREGAPSLVIEHENLDDKIYTRLKRMIAERELEPGQRILQEKLARDMGASRTPLVNALKRLAQERLVEWVPRRGIYVRRFTKREMAQLFEVREGLESIAARLAATRIDPTEVNELTQMFASFDFNPSPTGLRRYIKCDRYFHWRLVELAGNPDLAAAMESVNMMISAYQIGIPRTLAETLPEHRAILEALRRQDPEGSEAAMRVHIRRSVERLHKDADAEETGGKPSPHAGPSPS